MGISRKKLDQIKEILRFIQGKRWPGIGKYGAIESKGQPSVNVAFYSRGVWLRESTVSESELKALTSAFGAPGGALPKVNGLKSQLRPPYEREFPRVLFIKDLC